jgi:hypothetical protein
MHPQENGLSHLMLIKKRFAVSDRRPHFILRAALR